MEPVEKADASKFPPFEETRPSGRGFPPSVDAKVLFSSAFSKRLWALLGGAPVRSRAEDFSCERLETR